MTTEQLKHIRNIVGKWYSVKRGGVSVLRNIRIKYKSIPYKERKLKRRTILMQLLDKETADIILKYKDVLDELIGIRLSRGLIDDTKFDSKIHDICGCGCGAIIYK